MSEKRRYDIPRPGDGSGLDHEDRVYRPELELAFRNRAMPAEALRYDVTPPGLHYVLVHYDIPHTSEAGWELLVDGAVERPLRLSLADLQRRPQRTVRVTFECAGDGRALMHPRPISQPWLYGAVGTSDWTGTPLRGLLEEVGLRGDVVDIVFTGADRGIENYEEQEYQRAISRDEAWLDDVLVAWAMNGQPIPPQHGYPLRMVVPGWFGMGNVKWLRRITAITEPFTGYQQALAYRYSDRRDDPGEPVDFMQVRSLMEPPGIPEFLTRTRIVERGGPIELSGRAWSGRAEITRVEVSTDGGATWLDAAVDPAGEHPHAWQRWRCQWTPSQPGVTELLCRATDSLGRVQPVDQSWNARGMGNNQAHRVRVQVM